MARGYGRPPGRPPSRRLCACARHAVGDFEYRHAHTRAVDMLSAMPIYSYASGGRVPQAGIATLLTVVVRDIRTNVRYRGGDQVAAQFVKVP